MVIESGFRPAHRAIHQGCAVSGYIYLLNAEILATLIQNNKDVKCIPIDGTTIDPVSKFVDDMCLFTMADARSLDIGSEYVKIQILNLKHVRNSNGQTQEY